MSADHSASSEQHLLREGDLLTITDAIPIDITVLAADGAVLYVNQFALSRFGLSAGRASPQLATRIYTGFQVHRAVVDIHVSVIHRLGAGT
jgi:hypothetical protein